jgi:hypothetical protein
MHCIIVGSLRDLPYVRTVNLSVRKTLVEEAPITYFQFESLGIYYALASEVAGGLILPF